MFFNHKSLAGAVVLAIGAALPAQATVFNFTIMSANGNASGQLTATDQTTSFLVTGITGAVDGNAITGLVPNYGGNDNLVFTTPSYVDRNGLAFSAGGLSYSIFRIRFDNNVPVYGFCSSAVEQYCTGAEADNAPVATLTLTAAPAAVPEPAIWMTMIGGFGLIGGAMRRRRTAIRFA